MGGHRQFAEVSGKITRLGDLAWRWFQNIKYGDSPGVSPAELPQLLCQTELGSATLRKDPMSQKNNLSHDAYL